MISCEEKVELIELLEHRTRNPWEIRRERLIAAEARVGFWKNGVFVGEGLAELIEAARRRRPLTREQFIVANIGMLPEDVPARRGKHGERQS
jgi:hypothetical protein